MKIIKGRIEDIKSIKEMNNVSLKAKHSLEYFINNLGNILIAVEEGKVLGYIMVKGEEVMNLVVHPNSRGKGIGKKLIEEVMKKSKRLVSRSRENNKNAIDFLKKVGFKEKRKIERYYSNGDNAIEMEWRL